MVGNYLWIYVRHKGNNAFRLCFQKENVIKFKVKSLLQNEKWSEALLILVFFYFPTLPNTNIYLRRWFCEKREEKNSNSLDYLSNVFFYASFLISLLSLLSPHTEKKVFRLPSASLTLSPPSYLLVEINCSLSKTLCTVYSQQQQQQKKKGNKNKMKTLHTMKHYEFHDQW